MTGYLLADADGEYSADPSDYWYRADADRFDGMVLIKRSHPFLTVTGRIVYGPRLLKSDPTMADLRRLQAVIA